MACFPRAGVQAGGLDKEFTQTELNGLKDGLAVMAQSTRIKDDRIAQLGTVREPLENLSAISEVPRWIGSASV